MGASSQCSLFATKQESRLIGQVEGSLTILFSGKAKPVEFSDFRGIFRLLLPVLEACLISAVADHHEHSINIIIIIIFNIVTIVCYSRRSGEQRLLF